MKILDTVNIANNIDTYGQDAVQKKDGSSQTAELNTELSEKFEDNDSFNISDEAKRLFLEQLASSKESNPMEEWSKLLEIANRIAKGDSVPPSDEKKLLEADPDLYLSAKSAAVLNADKKHKKHKALFEDEENGSVEDKVSQLKIENDFADYKELSSDTEAVSEGGEVSSEMPEG